MPKHFLSTCLCFVLTIAICGIYMKGLMFDPNEHAPTFGGDGLTIHYNLQFHATYGKGTQLTSQYHPHTETIFMTDAQGLLAVVLAQLRPYFPGLPAYSVGISNFLIYWSNGIAACIIFLCLIKIKVDNKLAIALAVLIALLSPQIHRQTCGHYALGYAFVLPTVFYFLVHKQLSQGYIIKAGLLTLLLITLGLNNPYLLAISCSLLLACFGVGLLASFFGFKIQKSVLFSWLAVALLSLFITQGILHSIDEVTDRVKVPFGFFENVASFKGLLFPDETWLAKPLSSLFSEGPNSFESRSFIGFIPLLVLLGLPITFWKKKRLWTSTFNEGNLAVIFLGSIAVLVFAFGEPFSLFKAWSLEHLGQVLQFRAPGRFTWVFYFAASLVTARYLSELLNRLQVRKKQSISLAIIIPLLLVWSIDAHQFLSWRTKNRIHHNAFSPEQLQPYSKLTKELGIDTTNYQGIYLLPTEHGWTDKVYHDGSWSSNYNGYRLSVATGLPLINGKLSRASLSRTLNSMQLISNPLIKRPLLKELSSDKAILVLRAADQELKPHEASFFDEAEIVYSSKEYVLGKIEVQKLKENLAQKRTRATNFSDSIAAPLLYEHYESSKVKAFVGKGSRKLDVGKQTILAYPISVDKNDSLNISLWYYADPSISGGPWWTAQSLSKGKVTEEQKTWSLNLTDTQKGWLRVEFLLPVTSEIDEIKLLSEYRNPAYIDELLVRRAKDTISLRRDDLLLYNNYIIE